MQYLFCIYFVENLKLIRGFIMEEVNVQNVENTVNNQLLSRRDKRKAGRINEQLLNILASFYRKISSKQLSDSELKDTFAAHNKAWCKVCNNHKLNSDAKKLFALEVKQTWEKKKEKSEAN